MVETQSLRMLQLKPKSGCGRNQLKIRNRRQLKLNSTHCWNFQQPLLTTESANREEGRRPKAGCHSGLTLSQRPQLFLWSYLPKSPTLKNNYLFAKVEAQRYIKASLLVSGHVRFEFDRQDSGADHFHSRVSGSGTLRVGDCVSPCLHNIRVRVSRSLLAMATMNLEADCVVSPTSATPPQPSQHNRFLSNGSQQTQTQTPISQRRQSDQCFKCKELGHWASECPLKTPTKSTPSPSAPTPSPCDLPAVSCPHCQVTCTVMISQSAKNPGKKYYTCRNGNENGRGFFKWFDDVIKDFDKIPPSSMYPRCGCDAGICRLMVDINEPNVGRYYFVCPIAKGHGACRFRLYIDDTWVTDTLNRGLREGGELSFEQPKKRKIESLIMDNLQHPSSSVSAITEPVENVEEAVIEREENDLSSGMSTLQDMVPEEVVPLEHLMEKALQVSSLPSLAIHRRQAEYWRQISAAGDASIADPINQFLGLQILGWLGRLAFPPSGCLTVVPPRPSFCCLSDPSNAESDSSTQIVSQDTQRSSGVLFELSGVENVCGIQQGFDVNGPILDVLRQAALLCQRELLSRLDTMDPLDHKKMAVVADHYFTALNDVSAECTSFSERVRKFIARASSLAEIERTIKADSSAQVIMERYEEEKLRHNNIIRSYVQTVDAVTASEQHIKSLRKEASHVKEMLLKIENQLRCCEAENEKLKGQACEISDDMVECEKKMNDAYEEVEAAKKLGEEREVARSAAKAALEEARIQLRR